MLNSKKSFLQKARIAMVAIVTIISLGGAYAMNSPKHQSGTTWGVVQTNANSYQVTAVTDHSACTGTMRICKIQSATAPDQNGDIPKADATVLQHGVFSK
jgi:anti-sigma-K factor RskA